MLNDIKYYASLLICLSLGSEYKQIADPGLKRNFGAGVGILLTCLICGHEVYHTLLMICGNILIIKNCNKSFVHRVSLIYTWSYLLYLHFTVASVYTIWIYQTMALRLVGLAFDINSRNRNSKTYLSTAFSDTNEPSAVDIVVYSYFFIGLHRGPYFRWPLYYDHFLTTSFGVLGDYRMITNHKIRKAIACLVLFILLKYNYPLQAYFEDDFYMVLGSDYRFLYNVPQLLMFFLHYQIVMMLCTSVCTEAGFGVYPVNCESKPGHGPSEKLHLLKMENVAHKLALEQEYNFEMLKCFENKKLLIGPKMKDTLRGWDMPTRYWFWSKIYRNLLNANKEVRSASSFVAWMVWCGPSLQQMIVCATLWVYINIEAEYSSLYDTTGSMKAPWDIGFSIMRLFCLIYLTPCLTISDTNTVLKYYNSLFWMFHLLMFVLLMGAVILYKTRSS